MLVYYSGLFTLGLLIRIILAITVWLYPGILLGIASNDAMGFVELAKEFSSNFTLSEFKKQIELNIFYNIILGFVFKILYPSQLIGNLFSVLIWAHSFYLIYSILTYLKLSKNSIFYALLYFTLSPCLIIFTSVTLRDCIILYFLINFLFFFLRFYNGKKFLDFIILLFFLFLIYLSHYNFFFLFIIFGILLSSILYLANYSRIYLNIYILSFFLFLLLVNLFNFEHVFAYINNFQQGSLDASTIGRANYLENFYKIQNIFSGIFYIIRNYFLFILEPSFLNMDRLTIYDFGFILEKYFKILILIIFVFHILYNKKNFFFSYFILIMIFSIDASWSIGTFNWGTAYRHQVTSFGFLPFFIAYIFENKNIRKV